MRHRQSLRFSCPLRHGPENRSAGAHACGCGCGCGRARAHTRVRPLARETMCFSSFKTPEISNLIPAFRINGTNGMQSGVHGERARLACRAVRPARHTGRPQEFGTPWVAACIPRGRGIRHARRVRSPNHAMLLFQPLFPVSIFLKDRIISVGSPGHPAGIRKFEGGYTISCSASRAARFPGPVRAGENAGKNAGKNAREIALLDGDLPYGRPSSRRSRCWHSHMARPV